MEFIDRYSATGTPEPKLLTCCHNCDGMGIYPTQDKSKWPKGAKGDRIGYEIVKCEVCEGTRKCSTIESIKRIPKIFMDSMKFFRCFAFDSTAHPPEWSVWKRLKVVSKISLGIK